MTSPNWVPFYPGGWQNIEDNPATTSSTQADAFTHYDAFNAAVAAFLATLSPETAATIKAKLGITTLSGSNTGDQTSVTGNAGTATKLATSRTIYGVAFDGTANVNGWGRAARNPQTGMFHVRDYGPSGVDPASWTVAQTGAAVRAARDAAASAVDLANGVGSTVYFDGQYFEIDADPSISDPVSGLPYCAIKTWDYLTFRGTGRGTTIKLTASANCHVFGHPGRQQSGTPPQAQDQIMNVTWRDLTIDGNRSAQDGAHIHDGLHIDQHPGLELDHVTIKNCDGKGYFSTALGEFGTGGVNAVQIIKITDCRADNNAQWGWFMSATNRNASYKGVYATGNGSPQARIVGKTVATAISGTGGNLVLGIDNHANVTVVLAGGDSPAAVVTKINTGIGALGTAALTASGLLMITSATTGGIGKVYQINSSTSTVLTDLGLTNTPGNGDNNHKVGANEYGGFFLDHSECVTDGLFADQNYGDGFYIHNVNACHYGALHATRNTGFGIYVDAFNHSGADKWVSMMNCSDFGAASYRANAASGFANTAELYFDNGTEGYGVTKDSTLVMFNGPGDKTTIGAGADNRHANYSIVIANGVAAIGSFDIFYPKYGDGGLVGTLLDQR